MERVVRFLRPWSPLAIAMVLLGHGTAADAQCNATQLCPANADPCVVSSSCTVPAGSTFDLGARALVIRSSKQIEIDTGTDPLIIRAGSILMEPGARIIAKGTTTTFGSGGNVQLESASTFTLQTQGRDVGKIDVTGPYSGGSIVIRATGNIAINGNLLANSSALDGFGGQVDVFSEAGQVDVTGGIMEARGGGRGENGASGGSVSIAGAGDVMVAVPIDVQGGDCSCDITLDSFQGSVRTTTAAVFTLNGLGLIGDGGSVSVSAGVDAILPNAIDATARGTSGEDGQGGGFGGELDVFAGGSIAVGGEVQLDGAFPDGDGGSVDLQADLDVAVTNEILARTTGFGAGGDMFLSAGRNLVASGVLSVRADEVGGAVELVAGAAATISGTIEARATFFGGSIAVQACDLEITPTGLLDATGPGVAPQASNVLRSSGSARVKGRLLAGAANRLLFRGSAPVFTPPPVAPPHVVPPAQVVADPTLPCCVSCPVCGDGTWMPPDEQCDDGNTVSGDGCSSRCTVETTTTTVTVPTTTSSTVIGTTTTSVTTSSVTFTTTTAPAPTTTSSTTTTTSSTTTTTAPPVCGNRQVEFGEQCDDGNTAGGDCCSGTCRFEAAGSACPADANACTADVCNATGTCTHAAGNAGAVCRPSAGACDVAETCSGTATTCPADGFAPASTVCRPAAGACDAQETCSGSSAACPADAKRTVTCRPAAGACDVAEQCDGVQDACPADASADDGTPCPAPDACTASASCQAGVCTGGSPVACLPCESCDPGSGGCRVAPREACRAPVEAEASQLKIKRSASKGPAGDQLQWKWGKGADVPLALFGDPLAGDGLALCIYDTTQPTAASLLFRALAPAGGTCGTKPCWASAGSKGWKFASKLPNASGVTAVKLVPGAGGKAKVELKGKGALLSQRPNGLPALPLTAAAVTVQLQSETGACFGATFDPALADKNRAEEFKATGQ